MPAFDPKDRTTEERFAVRAQRLMIRKNVAACKPIPATPSIEEFSSDFKFLAARERADAQLELVMKLMSPKMMEQARGMWLATMAQELRQLIQDYDERLDAE